MPTGHVGGRVLWVGERPTVPPIHGLVRTKESSRWENVPNDFAPRIDPGTGGLGGAVVWLSGIDPRQGKPWPYPPAMVEVRDARIRAKQGDEFTPVAFARVGDDITLSSVDVEYHMLRARGAAFFTVPLPRPNAIVVRRLDRAGHVEFSSGAGYFWSAADVFACEHPYFARTQPDGTFRLDGVPPGDYEAVAWLRNWKVLGADRDPETGRTMRLSFAEPFIMRSRVRVNDGAVADVTLTFPAPPGGPQ